LRVGAGEDDKFLASTVMLGDSCLRGRRHVCKAAGLAEGNVEMRREIRAQGLSQPVSHYTDAVQFNNLLFISGVAPFDAHGRLVAPGDVVAQTRQIFENMKQILAGAGIGFSEILRVTVYLTDVKDRSLINPIRQEYFGSTRPASTLIGVSELIVPGMKVEIEAIAALRSVSDGKAA
jgi:2-iminobutanoate/2-iminopropanoate deaminase